MSKSFLEPNAIPIEIRRGYRQSDGSVRLTFLFKEQTTPLDSCCFTTILCYTDGIEVDSLIFRWERCGDIIYQQTDNFADTIDKIVYQLSEEYVTGDYYTFYLYGTKDSVQTLLARGIIYLPVTLDVDEPEFDEIEW